MIFWLLFFTYALVLSTALAFKGYRSYILPTNNTLPNKPKKILIVGATGGTGRQLVTQALERGYIVTALARHPDSLQISHPQLTVVQGNVLDRASLEKAIQGQQAVLSALGHTQFFYPTRILSEGTKNILQVMEAQKVSRFICETSLGIGDSVGRLGIFYTLFIIPVILPFYFWDKTRQEQFIAKSKLEWIIVRPGALKNSEKRGHYKRGHKIGNYLWTVGISRADVADFMLNQLESNIYLRTATGIAW